MTNPSVPSTGVTKFRDLLETTPMAFGMMYCPEHFRMQPSDYHIKVSSLAFQVPFLAIQAPRESAKSTVLTFLHTLHGLCFKRYRFIVIVQNTFSKAAGSLDGITTQFKENEDIKADFGVIVERDASGDRIFRHPDGFKTRVLCKGADQIGSVRGEKFDAWRPDLIIVDDLEDDELVRNSERRHELQKTFDEALIPAGEKGKVRVIVIGTILHDDCLMAKLVSKDFYPEYRKLFYKARAKNKLTGELESLWEEKWSLDDLKELERTKPSVFAKEYQGDPSSGSQETILREDFRYWAVVENKIVLYNLDRSIHSKWDYRDCKAAIACDLAWEDKQSSDFSCIMPGMVTPNNDILVCPFVAKRGMRPNELEELIFSLSKKYEDLTGKRVQVGFEKAKLEKVMKWFLQEAQRRRNEWLWLKDISWGSKDKVERVLARLGNRYAQHSVYHQTGMGELENQLIRLRSSAHDDLADCAGMLPEMLSFASQKQKSPEKKDLFNFLRTQTSVYRSHTKTPYIFGRKTKPPLIPYKVALPI